MQAVILAAGKGERLGPLTQDLPKCLLEIGGRPLLLRSLDCLAAAGIGETLIVTGYLADRLRECAGTSHGSMDITYVHNGDFETTGSMVSLLAAAEHIGGDFLLLEADLLYHRRFAEIARDADRDVMLTADFSGSGDEVYVCADGGGHLTFLGKTATAEQRQTSRGEFAGITKMSPSFLTTYCDEAAKLLDMNQGNHHYEEVILAAALNGAGFGVKACPGLPWVEIDNAADLARARNAVWPRIQAEDGAVAPANPLQ